jgi:ligand-binding SRPBCC domain-containing protein
MAKIYSLKSIQKLPVSLEEAWNFFSDAGNLLTITPPFLNLKITNKQPKKEMYPGQIITYKVKPLLGIPVFWMTEITHVERYKLFVDEQRKGPYTLWHHQHHFSPITGGVEMTDIVHYSIPFGPFGRLAHLLTVKDQLKKIFTYRYFKVNELFGDWPGEELYLELE